MTDTETLEAMAEEYRYTVALLDGKISELREEAKDLRGQDHWLAMQRIALMETERRECARTLAEIRAVMLLPDHGERHPWWRSGKR